MIVRIDSLYKSFPDKELFKELTFQVNENEKVGIIGSNGVGKTTLFHILEETVSYDKGNIIWKKGIEKGFLNQLHTEFMEETVEEYLKDAYIDLLEMKKELEKLENKMKTDQSEKILSRYASLQEAFIRRNGYHIEHEINNLLTQFSFELTDLDKKMSEFSGGQRTRLAFVKLFLKKPDVIFLDEPTNHLDIETVEWLEQSLIHYDGTVVLSSHDRYFIDRVCNVIIDIDDQRAYRYKGNYSEYKIQKENDLARHQRKYQEQQKKIKRLEALIEKFKANSNKASFVKSKEKYLDRMDKLEERSNELEAFKANFKVKVRGGKDVFISDNLEIGYDAPLLKIDLHLIRQRRYAVLGENGSGKSTLLKTIAGRLHPLNGEMLLGHQIEIAYFDQNLLDFSYDKTVLEEVWDSRPDLDQHEIRSALASFLFRGDSVFKDVSVLSGGERVRLSLLKMMLQESNFLILDEPTNHLDIESREALEEALESYDGTILFVSHDRYFVERLASDKIYLKDGSVYHDELEVKKIKQEKIQKSDKEKQSRKLEYKERKRMENRMNKIESLLEDLHEDLESHRELRFEPDYYHNPQKMDDLDFAIDEIHNEIKNLEKEWEELLLELEIN